MDRSGTRGRRNRAQPGPLSALDGVERATTQFSDGQTITVDGDTGVVTAG